MLRVGGLNDARCRGYEHGGLWLMTDRRLSFGDGRATVNDAVKVFEFQGTR
jgi:hypothetical protein